MNTNATATAPTIQQWGDLSWAYRDAIGAHERAQAEGELADELEKRTDTVIAARDALLAAPAPNQGALLEKLAIVFEDDGTGFTTSWNRAHLAPTFADMERLLQVSARDRLATVTRYAERMASQLSADLLDISEAATFSNGDPSAVVNLAGDALTSQEILSEQLRELADLIEEM